MYASDWRQDPRFVAPLPAFLSDVTTQLGGFGKEALARRRTRKLSELEEPREREATLAITEQLPYLYSSNPEERAKALEDLKSRTYTYPETEGFVRRTLDKLQRLPQGQVPLLGTEELRTVAGIPIELSVEEAKERTALARARALAEIPFETTSRQLEKADKTPTQIGPEGPAWDIEAETKPGLGQYEAETRRISATRPRGGGGAGMYKDITSAKKKIVDIYLYEYGKEGQVVYKKVLNSRGVPIEKPAQDLFNTYGEAMIGASSPEEADEVYDRAEAVFESWDRSNNPDPDAALARLGSMRADLYMAYGQQPTPKEPEESTDEFLERRFIGK